MNCYGFGAILALTLLLLPDFEQLLPEVGQYMYFY